MEADNDNLLKEDVDKINFTLVAFDGKEQTPLKATLSSKSLTENKKATYVYEIEQSSAHMLASGTKYTITATADYLLILYILNHIAKYLTVWSLPRQPWELMYGIP